MVVSYFRVVGKVLGNPQKSSYNVDGKEIKRVQFVLKVIDEKYSHIIPVTTSDAIYEYAKHIVRDGNVIACEGVIASNHINHYDSTKQMFIQLRATNVVLIAKKKDAKVTDQSINKLLDMYDITKGYGKNNNLGTKERLKKNV